MALADYLIVPGVQGDAASGEFTVTSYDTGSTPAVDQPLTVDLSVVSGGSNQLALDAQNGTVLPTVTLQEVTLGGKEPTVEKITLTGATVSSVQAAGGEVAVSFNYQSETVQPYIQRPDGSIVAGTPITHTGGTFATPTPQVLPSANGADNYYLNVPGVTGPVTASGYSGDFQTTGYQFTTGPAGQAGPLLLTLQNGSDATGVSNLEQALWSNQDLGTVTLDVQKGGSTGQIETIQLSDAHVVSFTDPGGEVSVALSYSQAQVTNYTQNADGSAGTPTTVTWGASTIPSQVAPITPVALTNTAASLQVSGVLGDVASSGAFTVAGFSTGTEASGAGSTVDQPLTVDLSVVSGGSNQLALDAQNGTVLPTVTLQEVTLGGKEPTVEKITLTGATVSSVQAAGGEVAVSFNYQSETVQPYIQRPDGSIVAGTPITHTGGTFATPTPQVLPSANGADNYYLNVPGVTGPVTASGYSGDFQTTGYQFTTGPAGQAGPLLLTLQNGSDATGVSNLEQALWSNQDLGTVTLDVQKGGSTGQIETIQLSDAHVVSFTDPGGEVSVALSYSQAQVTNYTQNADGSAGTPTTVTWGASTIPSQVAPITPVALTNTAASLQVSGVLGDVASSGAFTVAGFSTGTEASGAGSTVDQPLTVDLSVVSGGSNQLALDAQNGTVLPTVTLQEVTLGGKEPTVEKITLTGATVSSVQAAGGEVAVSFNYQSETVQPYIQRPDGSIVAGTPITHTGGTFATPTPQVLPSANGADNYYLNVPGVTGPVTASGYSGDFQTTGYQFTTGPAGQAGPLLLTLQNGSDATGVSNLEQALWSNQDLGTVTLDVQKGGSTGQIETIQLSDAHVVSFTDPGGEVSVALSYSQAQVTNYTQNADGSAGTPTTVVIEGTACYSKGTHLRTPTGDRPIESLQPSDLLMTADGDARAIRWVGSRQLSCKNRPEFWPICVKAGSFGPDTPTRDLYLSPGHCVAFDEQLIQIEALLNGATVVQAPCDEVEYWHVELDSHDIVFAEGVPAESYLDTGNRRAFSRGSKLTDLFPSFTPKHWSETCLPLVFEGPSVERARLKLHDRAVALGYIVTEDSDAHIVADGKRIPPTMVEPNRLVFDLPEDCSEVVLVSRTFVPSLVEPLSLDRRVLGLSIARLEVDELCVDFHACTDDGWHGLETAGDVSWRWTSGAISLPPVRSSVKISLAYPGKYWSKPGVKSCETHPPMHLAASG